MGLVDASEDDVGAEDIEGRDFAPGLVSQMLRVDANNAPCLALFDVAHEIAAMLARVSDRVVAVRESRDTQFLELENLQRVPINTLEKLGSYDVCSKTLRRRYDDSHRKRANRQVGVQLRISGHLPENNDRYCKHSGLSSSSSHAT